MNNLTIPDVILNDGLKKQIWQITKNLVGVRKVFLLKSCVDFEQVHRAIVRNYEDGKINEVEFINRMTKVVKDYSFLIVRSINLSDTTKTESKNWCKKSFLLDESVLNLLFQIANGVSFVEKSINGKVNDENILNYLQINLAEIAKSDDEKFKSNLRMLEVFFTIFTKNKTFENYAETVLKPIVFIKKYENNEPDKSSSGESVVI